MSPMTSHAGSLGGHESVCAVGHCEWRGSPRMCSRRRRWSGAAPGPRRRRFAAHCAAAAAHVRPGQVSGQGSVTFAGSRGSALQTAPQQQLM